MLLGLFLDHTFEGSYTSSESFVLLFQKNGKALYHASKLIGFQFKEYPGLIYVNDANPSKLYTLSYGVPIKLIPSTEEALDNMTKYSHAEWLKMHGEGPEEEIKDPFEGDEMFQENFLSYVKTYAVEDSYPVFVNPTTDDFDKMMQEAKEAGMYNGPYIKGLLYEDALYVWYGVEIHNSVITQIMNTTGITIHRHEGIYLNISLTSDLKVSAVEVTYIPQDFPFRKAEGILRRILGDVSTDAVDYYLELEESKLKEKTIEVEDDQEVFNLFINHIFDTTLEDVKSEHFLLHYFYVGKMLYYDEMMCAFHRRESWKIYIASDVMPYSASQRLVKMLSLQWAPTFCNKEEMEKIAMTSFTSQPSETEVNDPFEGDEMFTESFKELNPMDKEENPYQLCPSCQNSVTEQEMDECSKCHLELCQSCISNYNNVCPNCGGTDWNLVGEDNSLMEHPFEGDEMFKEAVPPRVPKEYRREPFGSDVGRERKKAQMAQPRPKEDETVVPDEFMFESKVIFISNLEELPEALGDRVLAIQLNYDKDSALKVIDTKLAELVPEYPELTLDSKREILAFLQAHKKEAKHISIRTFIHIASIWMSNDPDKEKWALIQLRSQV